MIILFSITGALTIENTKSLVWCNDMNKLAELLIAAMKSLETLERGSLSHCTKTKSLQVRWFAKTEPKNEKDISVLIDAKSEENKDDILIERNRLITCLAKFTLTEGSIKIVKIVEKKFRVLLVHIKQNNKWFMTDSKPRWSNMMKEEDLKKTQMRGENGL